MEMFNEIKVFYNSELYNTTIIKIQKRNNIQINDKIEYNESLYNIDRDILVKSNTALYEIKSILATDNEKIVDYTIKKMSYFFSIKESEYGEFPEGEEVEIEDSKSVIHPFFISFLLLYIVEYFILKNKPEQLSGYLKARRIPQAKKYKKELMEIYTNL